MEKNEINLFKALGMFMKEMRSTFHTMCLTQFGSGWETNYAQTFSTDKIKEWNDRIRGGEQPENLIDFGNLVIFSEKHRDSSFFRRKFPRHNKSIATYFKDIAETRNRLMHFLTLDISMEETAYNHMIKISKILNLDTMIKELENLKNSNKKSIKIKTQKTLEDNTSKTKNTSNERVAIGKLVRSKMDELIENDLLSDQEIEKLQRKDYSKTTLHIQYPLLRRVLPNDPKNIPRYWVARKTIRGQEYVICSEWYEQPSNNDRPHFLAWYRTKNK